MTLLIFLRAEPNRSQLLFYHSRELENGGGGGIATFSVLLRLCRTFLFRFLGVTLLNLGLLV
jgi:hypothetical protein